MLFICISLCCNTEGDVDVRSKKDDNYTAVGAYMDVLWMLNERGVLWMVKQSISDNHYNEINNPFVLFSLLATFLFSWFNIWICECVEVFKIDIYVLITFEVQKCKEQVLGCSG